MIITLRVAELQPGNLTECFIYVSSTFLYIPGPVIMKAFYRSCSAPKCSRKNGSIFDRIVDYSRNPAIRSDHKVARGSKIRKPSEK